MPFGEDFHGSLYRTVRETQGGIMNEVVELGKPNNGLTITIGPDAAATGTVYDAIQLTHDSGRSYGNLQRVQYFTEVTLHGVIIVCQLRFSYITLDILLNPDDEAHVANLDALSKQPTLPVVEYKPEPNGGRSLVRRHGMSQAILVRHNIQTSLRHAVGYNSNLPTFDWHKCVVSYRKTNEWVTNGTEAEANATANGT
jgi:hypothetical protein